MAHPLLADFPVVIIQSVAWGDMDSFKHVNNVVYFRYFENARLQLLHALDFCTCDAVGPIIASTEAKYRRAVTWPDSLWVGARVVEVKEDRFTIEHRIVSSVLGEVTTEGKAVVVAYDYLRKVKTTLPESVRSRISQM